MKEELKNKIEKTKANAKTFWDKHGEAIITGVVGSICCGAACDIGYRVGSKKAIAFTANFTNDWLKGEFPEEYQSMLTKLQTNPKHIDNMAKYVHK